MRIVNIRFVNDRKNENILADMFVPYLKELSAYMKCTNCHPRDVYENLYRHESALHKYLIICDNDVAGFLIVQPIDESFNIGDYTWHLSEFYVRPEYRKRYVGMSAFCRCLDIFGDDLFLFVLKGNTVAMQFWRRAIEANCLVTDTSYCIDVPEDCDLICLHKSREPYSYMN